jgi:CDGSH-type Zn-finger protein
MGITIKVREHGSYLIEGDDVTVVDWNGVPYTVDRWPIALCRCGASKRKPFCDGSHKMIAIEPTSAATASDER